MEVTPDPRRPGWSGGPPPPASGAWVPPQPPAPQWVPPRQPLPPQQWVAPRRPAATQWVPQWQTPQVSAPQTAPAPPKPRTVATLVWCFVLIVGLLFAGSRSVSSAEAKSSTALSLMGGDGSTSWFTNDSSGVMIGSGTWARAHGAYTLASSGPDALGWWSILTALDRTTVDLARFSWSSGRSADVAMSGDEIFSLVNGQVRREVFSERGHAEIYKGGRLELPVDVRSGSTWDSAGTIIGIQEGKPGSSVPYTSHGSATTPPEAGLASAGCLDVAVDETYSGKTNTSTRTWCPGRGMVRFDLDGLRYTTSDPPAMSYPISANAVDWTRTNGASSSNSILAPLGGSLLTLAYVSRPGVLQDGALVVALKGDNDVVAIDPVARTGDLDHTVWRAHPGGVIVSCVTLGQVTVATTSERRVVAYGPTGLVLWVVSTPDSVNQAAIAFDGHILVASVDGTVQALDAATGRQVWRVKTPSELALQPVASGQTLVVIDENGTTLAFSTDGHELWRSAEFPASAYGISGGVLVVNERGASTLRGYDLATGNKLWRSWEPAIIRSFGDLDGVALAYTNKGVEGFDPSTGSVLWSASSAALDLVVVGGRAVLVTADSLVVVDRTGAETLRVAHRLSRLPQGTVFLTSSASWLVAMTSQELFRGELS